ncbi:hypothetical protein VSR34_18460, partial [Paraburkholderia sp. JHI2823]
VISSRPFMVRPWSTPHASVRVNRDRNRTFLMSQNRTFLKSRNIRRKDILGYVGQYQGVKYLHFETFMLPGDFDAYFGGTQLGNTVPDTPTTTDWWGHCYYMIPAGLQFFALPPGADAHNKLNGIEFTPLQTDKNELPLIVETYFSKGSKYTNVWSVAADGSRTPLTDQPVPEAKYEYDLYKRAKALYSTCPSDGYEMLRFGRILSSNTTQPTWVRVTYAAGKQGYIDISKAEIKKLSDADFPSFMCWLKVTDGNTPFGSDGLCDIDALKRIVKDAQSSDATATTEVQKADELSSYVRSHDKIRQALRGFICNAPSEWDDTGNETRWAKLRDKDGFYEGNEQGYQDFLKYLKEIQFWDVTGLPAGQKLWFFHPLAFIRHFRKCGWMSAAELSRAMPAASPENVDRYKASINFISAKYLNFEKVRISHFLGQTAHETANLRGPMVEHGNNTLSAAYETDAHYYMGPDAYSYFVRASGYEKLNNALGNEYNSGDGIKFRGRGALQITGRAAYADYWVYRAWLQKDSFDASWWVKNGWWSVPRNASIRPAIIDNPQNISARANGNEFNPIDVGGWFWVCHNINSVCDVESPINRIATASNGVSTIINKYDTPTFARRQHNANLAKEVLCDAV